MRDATVKNPISTLDTVILHGEDASIPDGSRVFLPEVHGERRGLTLHRHLDEVVAGKQSGNRDAQSKRPG